MKISDVTWNELRENARKTIRERFDFADYIAKLDKIYSEVISR